MDNTGTFPREYIYVATSWRNDLQPRVVKSLRAAGYEVYDFRNPPNGNGFSFGELTLAPPPYEIQPYEFIQTLQHPRAKEGFDSDYQAMQKADIFVLVLPCERDAHLELGWVVGVGKETHILLDNPCRASLMYQMVDHIHPDLDSLLMILGGDSGN